MNLQLSATCFGFLEPSSNWTSEGAYILQCRKRDLVFYGIAICIHPPKYSLKMVLKGRNM